jgi:hypothetical protein
VQSPGAAYGQRKMSYIVSEILHEGGRGCGAGAGRGQGWGAGHTAAAAYLAVAINFGHKLFVSVSNARNDDVITLKPGNTN